MQLKLNAAFALHKAGKLIEATRLYQELLDADPDDFNVLFLLGLVAYHQRSLHEAEYCFGRAAGLHRDSAEFHLWLGRTLSDLNRLDEAVASYDAAILLSPDQPEIHFFRGAALQGLHRHQDAVGSYDDAILLKPDYAEAFSNRGTALQAQHLHDAALESFNYAILSNPELPEAYLNRGVTFNVQGRFGDAVANYELAIERRPDYAQAYSNLGGALRSLQRLDGACTRYDQLIALMPNLGEGFADRALCFLARNELDQAIAGLQQALTLSPDYAEARWHLALILLLKGDFTKGFELYEWRKNVKSPMGNRAFAAPLWLGAECLAGKHILVHEEQGLGDVVQFGRYIGLLLAEGARVTFALDARLMKIMSKLGQDVEIVAIDELATDFECDFHCPLMSLPLAFKTDLNSIPSQTPYLFADVHLVRSLRARLTAGGKMICGVSWFSKNVATGRPRSVGLLELMGKLDSSLFTFVNLQYGDCASEIADLERQTGIKVISFPDIDNYADIDRFAALIEVCDVVVSIDNSTVHLAGALNKKTFVLLPYAPDWRWLMHRADSPWYPSLRLFRQHRSGDWDGVLSSLSKALMAQSTTP